MSSETGFEPQVIPVTPIPILGLATDNTTTSSLPNVTQSVTEQGVSPAEIANPLPPPMPIATEVIGTTLDTQQKIIKGSFTFGEVGSLKIGKYVNGLSGEINISPNGIVATDSSGNTTFTLDGTTGSATFKGTVAAGSLISGSLVLGGSGNGNGVLTIEDGSGNTKAVGNNTGFIVYDAGSFQFAATGAGVVATLGADGAGHVLFQPQGPGAEFRVGGNMSTGGNLSVGGTFSISGLSVSTLNASSGITTKDMGVSGTLVVGGVIKTAIVPSSEGYKALYCTESPEVWFMDFARVTYPRWWEFWKEVEYTIDPLFLEVTEGESIDIATDNTDYVQIWRRRKGFADKRFESKTEEEFTKNNEFWSRPTQ